MADEEKVTDAMLNEAALAIEHPPAAPLEEEAKTEVSLPPPQEELESSPPPTTEEKVEAEPEVKEPEPPPEKAKVEDEEIEDEPKDQGERSRLGRKLAEEARKRERLENQVTELMGALRNLTGQIQQARQPAQTTEQPEEEYTPDTIIATVADLEKYAATKQAKIQKASADHQVKYASHYLYQLQELGKEAGLDEDTYKEVFTMATNDDMKNPYNKTRSQRRDPRGDATSNFYGALSGVYNKRLAETKGPKTDDGEKVIPLKQEKAKGPMGITQPTKVETKKPREVVLDDAAKEFLAYTRGSGKGMSDETVQETLSSPIPSYLGGR